MASSPPPGSVMVASLPHRSSRISSPIRTPFAPELGQGDVEVGAHQVKLVVAVLPRVDCKLGGRQAEDQPAASRIDRFETKDVAQEGAVSVGVRAFDDRVRSNEHSRRRLRADRGSCPELLGSYAKSVHDGGERVALLESFLAEHR